jgi:large repetitive protein
MLTSRSPRVERRGIVLVLVLAMLGLLALVGVTFATYAAQAKINNKGFMLSIFQPQAEELIDFGLAQLITDTNDIRSVIRGHSLARDMFGNDATNNALLGTFSIVSVTQPNPIGQPTVFNLTTNIQSNDSSFFGYRFLRWTMQVSYGGPFMGNTAGYSGANSDIGTGAVTQSFEIIGDSGYNPGSNAGRTFTVNIPASDQNAELVNQTVRVFTSSNGPQPQPQITQLPGYYIAYSAINNQPLGANSFTLDGRWLHAFNGPGMGQYINTTTGLPASYYPNFRYTGGVPALSQPGLNVPAPGGPGSVGMDEDYDACDLENWFLAIQSADGQVMIPSFHRPAIIRVDPNNNVNDWTRTNQSNPNGGSLFADSAARILRPCKADGHDAATFRDLLPDTNTGKIPYDVDNDGDGTPDSVWLDLGYPARKDASGRLYKPLFAFMVIGLNGRIPLNTAGNLAAQVGGFAPNDPGWGPYGPPASIFGGQGTASHLGNSFSEVDPTYALQNAFDPLSQAPGIDGVAAFGPPQAGYLYNGTTYLANNTQVDNAGIDVRLTQLRNLLAGTRTRDAKFQSNGESNQVFYSTSHTQEQQALLFPNGIADLGDFTNIAAGNNGTVGIDPGTGLPYVVRTSLPIPGRWGEAQSIPGGPVNNPANPMGMAGSGPAYVNVLGINYGNPVRAGYSINIQDILNGLPPDAADDNFNTYDPFPLRPLPQGSVTVSDGTNNVTVYGGEVGDADYYDAAGALLFPAERMRRWVTPPDINGTGHVYTWNSNPSNVTNRGADSYGRVEFNSYFRPPGSPGVMSTSYTYDSTTGAVTSASGTALGAIYFPQSSGTNNQYYGSGPNPSPFGISQTTAGVYPYLPDLTSNPLHSLEAGRFPNQNYTGGATVQNLGGSPVGVTNPNFPGTGPQYLNVDSTNGNVPNGLPSYDYYVNSRFHSDGLNDADEMNYYNPNPLYDSPFGPADLEWLYRQQDVDGAALSSRLSELAAVSLTNGFDGSRRRRLFALDSWETNNFTWTNDNPVQPTFLLDTTTGNLVQTLAPVFPTNSRFAAGQSVGFSYYPNVLLTPNQYLLTPQPVPSPGLGNRDKKINLNYPLPVSNDPNEPVRQKWINETYYLLKAILPPKAVDTAEELAQLSQYVINIVDFRDTDCTMTHWQNPDVAIAGVPVAGATVAVPTTAVTLVFAGAAGFTNLQPLDQWGMEYNPVAINEVLAYSFLYNTATTGTGARANRFFIELVNTQTAPEISAATAAGFNPGVNLGGFVYNTPSAGGVIDPYPGAPWDIIFTGDDPYSRPDPYRGQLVPYANLYAVTPLAQSTFSPPTGGIPATNPNNPTTAPTGGMAGTTTDGYDVVLQPMGYNASTGTAAGTGIPSPLPAGTALATGGTAPLPIDYFYVIGNTGPSTSAGGTTTSYELNGPGPGNYWPNGGNLQGVANASTYNVRNTTTPSQIQSIKPSLDPVTGASSTTSPINLYVGVLPGLTNQSTTSTIITSPLPPNYQTKIPSMGATGQIAPSSPTSTNNSGYYWVCLRRPANLFAPVSASNPMVVVDSVRFPYLDGTGPLTTAGPTGGPPNVPTIASAYRPYSIQRYQPFRGGHAVPVPSPTGSTVYPGTFTTSTPVDPRYGYTDQIVVPGPNSLGMGTRGIYYIDTSNNRYYATQQIYHTLGWANEYEQGSLNSLADSWEYLPFNDRDFTSVAELMLVPGCSPGLFTKQFVEFAPAAGNVTSIFNAVTPTSTPPTAGPIATITGTAQTQSGTSSTGGTTSSTVTNNSIQAFNTASLPFAYVYDVNSTNTSGAPSTPQPRSYPYLNDEFFYSGFGGPITQDAGGQVGGYGADGWFKMFEFFEVPSQAMGAIGPVASGSNFDWFRHDIKPGQLNLNLIMDEEVFFSIAGHQKISQGNGQIYDNMGNLINATDQFTQDLLNFNQVQPLEGPGQAPIFYYALPGGGSTPQYPAWMLPQFSSPVPLVVTSTLANGTPATATPIATSVSLSPGVADSDPISNQFFTANNPGTTASLLGPWWPYSNSLKAAWVQFLTLRHGGSGYLFGFGLGAVGQNSAIAPYTPPQGIPGNLTNNQYATGIPAERPFHSLSYPDINYTLMRPAVLPPSAYTNPVANTNATTVDAMGNTIYYAGDPGVRNPTLFVGYPTANYPGTLPLTTTVGTAGTRTTPWGAAYEPVYPPAVPVRRLFQVADSYNGGTSSVTSIGAAPGVGGGGLALVNGASNASSGGDPYLNNTKPVGAPATNVPFTPAGALPAVLYTNSVGGVSFYAALTRNNVDLYWPGGSAASTYDGTAGDPAVPVPLPGGVSNPKLGANGSTASAGNPGGNADMREHPYWRSEQMQRLMNLTTPRTHQFAVWLTVGFFEVKRQGDLGMVAYDPRYAFDILGPEIGAANGKTTRYRGFYLVDRLRLTGFNPSSPTGFRQAIVYRQRIQ